MFSKVNIDHLCTIRKIGNRTAFEKVEIPASTDLIATLEGMVENENVTVLDMQSIMDYTYPKEERRYIDYVSPHCYSSTYIEGTYYPTSLSFNGYQEKLAQKAETQRKTFENKYMQLSKGNPSEYAKLLSADVKRALEEYKRSLKKNYLQEAKRFIMAKDYTRTLDRIKCNPDVRMYSTDTLGWSSFTYNVTDDITIILGTNFGYGCSSYFRLCLRYKGIDILPYSYVVKYYKAERCDILRYTRMYNVVRDSWNLAFDFVEKTANKAAEGSEVFVREFILGEIQQMMHILEKILADPRAYADSLANDAGKRTDCHFLSVRNMDIYEKRRYGSYPEEMTMVIKAEKITGSLDFLDNLTKLSESLPDITSSIEEIKRMSQVILPEITQKVNALEAEIIDLREKEDTAQRALDALNEKAKPHMSRIDVLLEEGKKVNKSLIWGEVEDKYLKKHDDYARLKAAINSAKENLYRISYERQMRENFQKELHECVKRVEKAGLAEKVAA